MSKIQWLKDWTIRHLPSPLYLAMRQRYYRFVDRRHTGTSDKPPRHLAFIYGFDPDFDKVGDEFLDLFKTLGGLQPHHHVLDVGCGIGRCALPLTRYLSPEGGYCGFDIRADGIAWCKAHISDRFPHFQFQHIDLRNATYHRGGKADPDHFVFPYPDDAFDLVFTKSVFTHLQAPVIQQYLKETARVLKPGGRSMHTFLLLNDVARQGLDQGTSQFDLRYPMPYGASVSRSEPEKAIAFEEPIVREWYAQAGLNIQEPIAYGKWSGRADGRSGQDIVVAIRP